MWKYTKFYNIYYRHFTSCTYYKRTNRKYAMRVKMPAVLVMHTYWMYDQAFLHSRSVNINIAWLTSGFPFAQSVIQALSLINPSINKSTQIAQLVSSGIIMDVVKSSILDAYRVISVVDRVRIFQLFSPYSMVVVTSSNLGADRVVSMMDRARNFLRCPV